MKINKSDTEASEICKRVEVTVINFEPILGIMDFDLPDWLLIEVLVRLPVKIIFRMKLVCKQWLSLISDPAFVRMYTSRVSMLQPLQQYWVIVPRFIRLDCVKHLDFLNIYSRKLKCPSYLPLHTPSTQQLHQGNCRIYGISNGLVLCGQIVATSNDVIKKIRTLSICNPVTEQWIALPPLTCQYSSIHTGFITQVEDCNLKSFRVVCLPQFYGRTNMMEFHVFFSESGVWKDFWVSSNLGIGIMGEGPGTELHRNLHWVLCQDGILAYDPYHKPNDLRVILLPRDKDQIGFTSICGVSDGKLRYFKLSGMDIPHGFSRLEIWILNDYSTGEWSLLNRINRFDIICDAGLCCLSTNILPISFDPLDPDIVYLGYINVIVSFNIKTKRLVAHAQSVSNGHDPYTSFYELPCWQGLMLLIPPWPTSIPPPSFKSTCLVVDALRALLPPSIRPRMD